MLALSDYFLDHVGTGECRDSSRARRGPPHSHFFVLAAIPNVKVVAGCDISAEAKTLFHQRWDSTWPGATTYTDFREMLEKEQIDLLRVATPDHLHGEVVRVAAASGVKAIFCEKPMSTDLADVDLMIAAIDAHGVVVNVNNTRRWVASYVAARERVRLVISVRSKPYLRSFWW